VDPPAVPPCRLNIIMADEHVPVRLVNEAHAAWQRYGSTVCMGGTPQQRAWAFSHALRAEQRVADLARITDTDHVRAGAT
jgi:hypothetical protein